MKATILITVLTMCSLLAAPVTATQPIMPQLFRVELAPEGKPVVGTPFDLQAHISISSRDTKFECSPYHVTCQAYGEIQIIQAPNTSFAIDSGQVFDTRLTVKCAPNDTARVEFLFKCGTGFWSKTWWFVSDDTTVVVQWRYPTRPFPPKPDAKARMQREFLNQLRADTARYRRIDASIGKPVLFSPAVTKELLVQTPVLAPNFEVPHPPLPGVPIVTRQQFHADVLSGVLADSLEVIWVEGTHYIRRAGDSLYTCFWCSGQHRDSDEECRLRNVLANLPKDHKHSIVLFLPREQLEAALASVSENMVYIGDWWRFSLYRCRTTLDQLAPFYEKGIPVWQDAYYPPIEGEPMLENDVNLQHRLFRTFEVIDTNGILQ